MHSVDRITIFFNVRWCIIYTYVQAAFYEDKSVICFSSFSQKMAHWRLKNDFFKHGWTSLVGLGLLFIEASRSHAVNHPKLSRTPLDEWSVHWRDLYLLTQTLDTDIHASGWILAQNSSRLLVVDPRLRTCGDQCNRPPKHAGDFNNNINNNIK